MLLRGFDHVAILTKDTERLHAFYHDMFEATVGGPPPSPDMPPGFRLSFIDLGDGTINVFQIDGNTEADHQVPMFGRGRIAHLAIRATNMETFEEIRGRLMAAGHADDFVTDFGPSYSLFFVDPDGLECEVVVDNPDAVPGVHNPPGTRAARWPG